MESVKPNFQTPRDPFLKQLVNKLNAFFHQLFPVGPRNGGTGLEITPTNNQILLGNTRGEYELKTLTAGTNITLDETNSSITINASGGAGYTDEDAQDAVGSILTDTTSVDFTYSDATPSITASVLPGGVDHNSLANLTTGDPHTQYYNSARLTSEIGVTIQEYDGDLDGISALSGTGLVARTLADTYTTRSITAGSSKVSVVNGGGITGNPTVDIVEANLTLSNLGGAVTDAQVPNTITIDNITQVTNRDHGSLQGLGDDDHTQYALLTGRNGGQTLNGGTAAADNLTLLSSSHGAPTGNIVLGNYTGTVDIRGKNDGVLRVSANGTNITAIEIAGDISGDAICYMDLHSQSGSDYDFRILRSAGANGSTSLNHRGAGNFQINAQDSAAVTLRTNSTNRVIVANTGQVSVGSSPSPGTVSFEVQGTDASLVPSGTTAQRPSGVNGYHRYNSTLGRHEFYENGAWVQYGSSYEKLKFPMGIAQSTSAVSAGTTNISYFVYMGKAPYSLTTCNLITKVTTAAVTITWAELGVFTGTFVENGNATLTRRGFTDVSATHNSLGTKTTTVALSGISPGDDLWVAWGSQASTPYVLRGGIADEMQRGVFQFASATRISTVAASTTMTLQGTTIIPAFIQMSIP